MPISRPVIGVILVFVTGALFGTLGDWCHVISGTTGYPLDIYPWYFAGGKMPFWVPLLFGSAGIAIGMLHFTFDHVIAWRKWKKIPARPGAKNLGMIVIQAIVFCTIYALSGFVTLPAGGLKDVMMGALALATWIAFDRTLQGFALGVMAAIGGVAVEIYLTSMGGFYYNASQANFLGVVPTWLGWLYMAASVTGGNFNRWYFASKRVV